MKSKKSRNSYYDKSRRAYIYEKQISNEKQALSHLEVSDDTNVRIEIHSFILSAIQEGKSKEAIKEELLSNKRYEKYESFFDIWIEDKLKQKNEKHICVRFEK